MTIAIHETRTNIVGASIHASMSTPNNSLCCRNDENFHRIRTDTYLRLNNNSNWCAMRMDYACLFICADDTLFAFLAFFRCNATTRTSSCAVISIMLDAVPLRPWCWIRTTDWHTICTKFLKKMNSLVRGFFRMFSQSASTTCDVMLWVGVGCLDDALWNELVH